MLIYSILSLEFLFVPGIVTITLKGQILTRKLISATTSGPKLILPQIYQIWHILTGDLHNGFHTANLF